MRFAHPWALMLLPLVALGWFFLRARVTRRTGRLSYPGAADVRRLGQGRRARLARILPALRVSALLVAIVALARPQFGEHRERLVGEAVDIVLALDVSGSMRAEDFQPQNRLHVAKARAADFVRSRNGDRIGLVIFAGDAFTRCPLTRDYGVLAGIIEGVRFEDVGDPNATAIGMAIATAANRLKASESKSKVVILLTDGINNAGAVDPVTAAELCHSLGIKVYTIGVGSEMRKVPFPTIDAFGRKRYDYFESRLDEESLTEVASVSGGLYFRATDPDALRRIYDRISEMEKTDIETEVYVRYSEVGPALALLALLLLASELILSHTLLLRILE